MTTTIDWSGFAHAYGPASDVPALLESAMTAPAPASYRSEPWYTLWSSLCHQGDVYTASYAALPELIGIAERRRHKPDVALECLLLAATIEVGRVAPVGDRPVPEIPAAVQSGYAEAIRRGAVLVAGLPMDRVDPAMRPAADIAAAAFRGDHLSARRLLDPPDEDDAP